MKTLLISGIYRPEVGGPATYIPALATCLQSGNHVVEVLTLKDSHSPATKDPWPLTYIRRDQRLSLRFFRTVVALIKIYKKIDVVFANGLHQETAVALFFRKKWSVAKVVGDPVWERARNLNQTKLDIVNFNAKTLPTKQKLQRIFLTWALNRFDVVTCPSRELSEIIIKWGVKKPVKFIANGIEIKKYYEDEKIYDVVSVSRLVSWKNIDRLITACQESDTSVAIVGSGPERKSLESLALSLSTKTVFLGELSSAEVDKVLHKSKIFALLSDYEGLSFALLQAMSAGLPSVVSMTRGNTDVIESGVEGIAVDVSKIINVSDAIQHLIQEPTLMAQYGMAARRKAERDYDQEIQLKKVIDLMVSDIYEI